MKPRINFITLAVSDIHRSIRFYKDGLGLPTKGIKEGHEDHILFDLEDGLSLVLYNRMDFLKIAGDANQKDSSAGFIISHIADSKSEVDEILLNALQFGGKQVGDTKQETWGYTANFLDPDGHQWEITFMPWYTTPN